MIIVKGKSRPSKDGACPTPIIILCQCNCTIKCHFYNLMCPSGALATQHTELFTELSSTMKSHFSSSEGLKELRTELLNSKVFRSRGLQSKESEFILFWIAVSGGVCCSHLIGGCYWKNLLSHCFHRKWPLDDDVTSEGWCGFCLKASGDRMCACVCAYLCTRVCQREKMEVRRRSSGVKKSSEVWTWLGCGCWQVDLQAPAQGPTTSGSSFQVQHKNPLFLRYFCKPQTCSLVLSHMMHVGWDQTEKV